MQNYYILSLRAKSETFLRVEGPEPDLQTCYWESDEDSEEGQETPKGADADTLNNATVHPMQDDR